MTRVKYSLLKSIGSKISLRIKVTKYHSISSIPVISTSCNRASILMAWSTVVRFSFRWQQGIASTICKRANKDHSKNLFLMDSRTKTADREIGNIKSKLSISTSGSRWCQETERGTSRTHHFDRSHDRSQFPGICSIRPSEINFFILYLTSPVMGRTRTKTKRIKPSASNSTVEAAEPPSIPSLLEKAQSLIVQCDYDLAQRFAQRILEREPRNVEAKEILGVTQLETGDIDSAKQVCLSDVWTVSSPS